MVVQRPTGDSPPPQVCDFRFADLVINLRRVQYLSLLSEDWNYCPQRKSIMSKFTPDQTIGGITAPGAYRIPEGAAPSDAVAPLVLPPNTDAEKFRDYIYRASKIVGEKNVTIISKSSELDRYDYLDPAKASDMFYLCDKDYFVCSAVVAPTGVDDVQALTRLANEFDIPIWPFSVGRNLGYGGAAPRVPGSVGIDMVKLEQINGNAVKF